MIAAAVVIIIVLLLIFVYSLCRMAADADDADGTR
jgi:hypothetical protein